MTGTAKVKPPKDNAEWARNVQSRLDQVEHPASSRVGSWVLSTDPDTGNLIASFVNGGSIILAKAPEAGTNPDDTVTTQPLPRIQLKRIADQGIPVGGQTAVSWDTQIRNVGGWGVTTLPVDTITVPEDGLYLLDFKLVRNESNDNFSKGFVQINGNVIESQEIWPSNAYYQTYYLSDQLDLLAGDKIVGGAYSNGGGLFGVSDLYPTMATSISLYCLERG